MPFVNEDSGPTPTEKPTKPILDTFYASDRHDEIRRANEEHKLGLDQKDIDQIMEVLPHDGEVDLHKVKADLEDKKSHSEYDGKYDEVHKQEKTLDLLKKLMQSR